MEISDSSQFNILLAFPKYLQPAEQCVVLKRRLKFLEDARSFFQMATNLCDWLMKRISSGEECYKSPSRPAGGETMAT
jgi:hypothetical protein